MHPSLAGGPRLSSGGTNNDRSQPRQLRTPTGSSPTHRAVDSDNLSEDGARRVPDEEAAQHQRRCLVRERSKPMGGRPCGVGARRAGGMKRAGVSPGRNSLWIVIVLVDRDTVSLTLRMTLRFIAKSPCLGLTQTPEHAIPSLSQQRSCTLRRLGFREPVLTDRLIRFRQFPGSSHHIVGASCESVSDREPLGLIPCTLRRLEQLRSGLLAVNRSKSAVESAEHIRKSRS
jgi:hypothetical protein